MVYYTKNPAVLVNPFFFDFLFFLTIIENMPYRTQISPQNSRKERISRSFLKTTRLRRLQFSSLPSRQSLLSSFPGIPHGIGSRNGLLPLRDGRYWSQTEQNSFLTQPARSGILLFTAILKLPLFKLQQLVSLSAPRSFRKQNDVFAFFYDIGRLIDNLH